MSISQHIQFKSTSGEKLMERNARTLLSFFALFMVLWMAPVTAHAYTVTVNCSPTKGRPQTISAALAALPSKEPNTLLILGTCNDNVNITTVDHLTITGNPTATLNALDPNSPVITILDSQDVTLNNLVINGATNNDGVDCGGNSVCRLNNVTIQKAGVAGLSAGSGSALYVNDCIVQGSGDMGIWVGEGSRLVVAGSTIQSNATDGISMGNGAGVHFAGDAINLGNTIQNNLGNGITAGIHGSLQIPGGTSSTISGNSGDGLALEGASAGFLVGVTIINNAGHGVRIGDLSFAQFKGKGNSISGNKSPNVKCDPMYSAVRGVPSATSDTDCPADTQIFP
jgi:hypothetical protein